ncbi:Imidazolonepropionase [Streptomyces tanashiensis]
MTTTLITNIATLVTNDPALGEGPLGLIADAALVLEGDRVAWAGPAAAAPAADRAVDAGGRAVIPGFVDSHSHLVFAGDRTAEFNARMSGQPYKAGGIRTTVAATRAASDEALSANVARYVREALTQGTTTFETKSGYGLTVEDEARALRIAAEHTDEVTYLGAHIVSPDYADDPAAYVELVTGEMLDACAPYARWVDVYCEKGAFDGDQARAILTAGKAKGLHPRVHANQLTYGPGVQLGGGAGRGERGPLHPSDGRGRRRAELGHGRDAPPRGGVLHPCARRRPPPPGRGRDGGAVHGLQPGLRASLGRMGNSMAHAVFTTTDAEEAYARARRLVALLEHVDEEAYVKAEARTVEEARQIMRLLPGAAVDHAEAVRDPVTGEYLFCELDPGTAGDDELRAEPPAALRRHVRRPGRRPGDRPGRRSGPAPTSGGRAAGRDDPEPDCSTFRQVRRRPARPARGRGPDRRLDPHHAVCVHVDRWSAPAPRPEARRAHRRRGPRGRPDRLVARPVRGRARPGRQTVNGPVP